MTWAQFVCRHKSFGLFFYAFLKPFGITLGAISCFLASMWCFGGMLYKLGINFVETPTRFLMVNQIGNGALSFSFIVIGGVFLTLTSCIIYGGAKEQIQDAKKEIKTLCKKKRGRKK